MHWSDSQPFFQLCVGVQVAFASFPKLRQPVVESFHRALRGGDRLYEEMVRLEKRMEENTAAEVITGHPPRRQTEFQRSPAPSSGSDAFSESLWQVSEQFNWILKQIDRFEVWNVRLLIVTAIVSFGIFLLSCVNASGYLSVGLFFALVIFTLMPIAGSVGLGMFLAFRSLKVRRYLDRKIDVALSDLAHKKRAASATRGSLPAPISLPSSPRSALFGDALLHWLSKRPTLGRFVEDEIP